MRVFQSDEEIQRYSFGFEHADGNTLFFLKTAILRIGYSSVTSGYPFIDLSNGLIFKGFLEMFIP
jgi:hypothetical protein